MTRFTRRRRALALGVAALATLAPAATVGRQAAAAPEAAAAPAPLTLAEALALARTGNEVSGVAAARVERAAALRRQALSQLLPSLTVTGVYTRRAREVTREVGGDEVTVQALDAFSGTAVAETTLFDLRALPGVRAATRGLEAQRIESAELERALAYDVAETFLTVLGADGLLGAAERRVRVAEQTVEESRLRLDAGLANRNDLTRAELELATARLESTRSARDAEAARLALGFLIAAPVDRPLAAPDPFSPLAAGRDALVARALAERPELAALERRLEAARQAALAPRLGIVPTLDLRGTWRWTNEAGLSGREEDWNLGLTLGWQLWDGGSRSALADQLDADARVAELALAEGKRRAALEVEQALADLEAADAAFAQAEVQFEAARQNAEEVRERYRAGLATALEQADATVSQFEAEANRTRQRYLSAVSRLALERALGAWPLAVPPPEENPAS